MRESWPLVARDEELALIREVLARTGSAGAVVAGAAGTGKSRLLAEAMRLAAASGFDVERIVASRSAATVPFAAFSDLLPDADPTATTLDRLRSGIHTLATRARHTPVVLVVDDAHHLDEASATLLHRAVLGGTSRAVIAVRTGEPVPDAVSALWKDAGAERLDLHAFSYAQTAEFVRRGLGGEVDGATIHRLWTAGRGNPLSVREFALAAVAAGTMQQDGGVWVLTGPLRMPGSLAELVGATIAGLPAGAAGALRTVAIAEAIGLEALRTLHPSGVEELERRALVVVVDEGRRRTVRLMPPLDAGLLRAGMPRTEQAAISRSLAELAAGRGARRRDDALRTTVWRLDAGSDVDPAGMFDAARQAYGCGDLDLAERLLRDVTRGANGGGPQLLLAQILHDSGRHTAAEGVYAELGSRDVPAPMRVEVAVRRAVNLFVGLGRADAAIAELTTLRTGLRDTRLAAVVASTEAWLNLVYGRARRALKLVTELGAADEVGCGRAAVVTSWIDAASGRPAASAGTGAGLTPQRSPLADPADVFDDGDLPRALALVEAGRLADAGELIGGGNAAALVGRPAHIRGWWILLAGILSERRGRVRTAAGWFRQGAALQRRGGRDGYLRWNLGGLALAQVLAGDVDGARATLAEEDRIGPRPERLFTDLSDRARCWVAALSGDGEGARAALVAAAEATTAAGRHPTASVILHDLVRLNAPESALAPLRGLAIRVASPAVELRAAHAAAAVDRDAAALARVAAAWEDGGADLLAAEAYAEASSLLVTAGDPRRAQRLRTRAALLAGACEGAVTPALLRAAEVVPLTPREREVALLAAASLPSREIGDRLGISRRTVDNLLQRVYVKLGVHGRGELAAALAIGSPSPSPAGAR